MKAAEIYAIPIVLTHIFMTTHSPRLEQALQQKVAGLK